MFNLSAFIILLPLMTGAQQNNSLPVCDDLLPADTKWENGSLIGPIVVRVKVNDLDQFDTWQLEMSFTNYVLTALENATTVHWESEGGDQRGLLRSYSAFDLEEYDAKRTLGLRARWGKDTNFTGIATLIFTFNNIISSLRPHLGLYKITFNNKIVCRDSDVCGITEHFYPPIFSPVVGSLNPWMAAIFLQPEMKFQCAGTFVSNKYIITAAHCVNTSHDLVVYLGAGNITTEYLSKDGVQMIQVSETILHAGWLSGDKDADLAVLVLSSVPTIDEYVRPACLMFHRNEDFSGLYRAYGWGDRAPCPTDNTTHSAMLTDEFFQYCAQALVVGQGLTLEHRDSPRVRCLREYYRRGFHPCLGDGGCAWYAGVFRPHDSTRNAIAGFITRSVSTPYHDKCTPTSYGYGIFTNLWANRFWLQDVIGLPITWLD